MPSIREEARDIPVVEQCDICVVGGSCTGVFAAVAAARLGAKVAIVEQNGFLGGVATASLVNIWHSLYNTTGDRQIIAGLTGEVVERLARRSAAVVKDKSNPSQYITLHTEELKIELDDLVAEAKVRPFLHAVFAAPVVQDGRLAAVIIEDKSGRRAIQASYFIDATGDADVVHRAGFECYRHLAIQPPTMCAILRGLGDIKQRHPDFELRKAVYNTAYPNALKKGFLWSAAVPGAPDHTMVAGTRVPETDASDAEHLTLAEIEGRRQVRAMCDILRENFMPAGEHPLVALPARIGIRDSRHARCLYSVSEQEVLNGVRFGDAIANGSYRVDVHYNDRPGIIFRYLDGTEVHVFEDSSQEVRRWREASAVNPTFYQVPYRCLVPQGAKNLLVAGRALDADRGAYGAIRVMVNCNQMGQAAGVASYLALNTNVDVANVNIDNLRKTLTRQGAIVI
jgi:2-polyprenyl-6-methoxyphenol hydroxylase-like FAD-dependent oxidoreductase